MNERIRELLSQCQKESIDGPEYAPWTDLEKFSELIIRECAGVCYHHSIAAGGVKTAFGYGYKDCGDDVKRHFGIEV